MIRRNSSILYKWPEEWRHQLTETVMQCYDLIGREKFTKRFDLFKDMRRYYISLEPIRERHPVELGFFLISEEPNAINYIAPGNYSWAYAFARLFLQLRESASPCHWKDIVDKVNEALGDVYGSEELSLNAIFHHMRFYDYLKRTREEKKRSDYAVVAGCDIGIRSDVAITRGSEVYGIDVKSLRQGWARSNRDYLLLKSLRDSKALTEFAKNGNGYVLITLPHLSFFGKKNSGERITALANFEKALESALDGTNLDNEVFEDVKTGSLVENSDLEIRNLIDNNLPSGHSKYIQRVRLLTHQDFLKRKNLLVCIYYKNDIRAFEANLLNRAKRCVEQAGSANRAILAVDFDFFSAWQIRDPKELDLFEKMVSDSIEKLGELLIQHSETNNIYGFFHGHDKPVNSAISLSSVQPLTDIIFLKNTISKFQNSFEIALDRSKIYDW